MAHLESLLVLDEVGHCGAALAFGFERAGYRVYAADQAAAALDVVERRVPQLVVVAVEDGEALSTVDRLRDAVPTRDLPVVAVGQRSRREEALRAGVDEFVTRPAFIRDVLTLSRLAVAARQDGGEEGVVGLLEDYGLYFLVRALAVAGRSGVLELERGRRLGELHFAKGAVVAARLGRMSGIRAFEQLLLWSEGSLWLRFETPTGERRIAQSVDQLLEAGAAFTGRFAAAAAAVGGPNAIYAYEPAGAATARAAIPDAVLAMVKLYDGRKPLVDVIEDSPFKPFDTLQITERLLSLGAIIPRRGREATSPSARRAIRDWLVGEEAPLEKEGLIEAVRRAAEAAAPSEGLFASRPAASPPASEPKS